MTEKEMILKIIERFEFDIESIKKNSLSFRDQYEILHYYVFDSDGNLIEFYSW